MKDKIFAYKESGSLYKIVDEALMKDPVTREWKNCVIYKQHKYLYENTLLDYPEGTKMTFVREKSDFLNKFEEVHD